MSTTTPLARGDSSSRTAQATTPMAAGRLAMGPSPSGLEAAAVTSGVATQYWDEAIPIPAGPNRLWLYVDNAWRVLDSPSPVIRDLVQRAFLGTSSIVQVWYDSTSSQVVGLVISGS